MNVCNISDSTINEIHLDSQLSFGKVYYQINGRKFILTGTDQWSHYNHVTINLAFHDAENSQNKLSIT